MFGIGLPELILITVVALIFIGPKQLPGVLRSVGKGLVEFKRATNEVRNTVQTEMDNLERDLEVKEIKQSFENDFGGVANKMGTLNLSKMSTGEKLESLASAFEKGQDKMQERVEQNQAATKAEAQASSSQSGTA
jgi:Tat protein translocase TatB subunit